MTIQVEPSDTDPRLHDATMIGQLVKASSPTSRYVCVHIGETFKLAARITTTQTSLRVEGKGGVVFDQIGRDILKSRGFQIADTGKYASVHYQNQSFQDAVMSVAAVVAGFVYSDPMGVVMPLHDIAKLPQKGA